MIRWDIKLQTAGKDKGPKTWKNKKEKEVGALNVEVLLGSVKVCTIK